jgi:hypothetical protein
MATCLSGRRGSEPVGADLEALAGDSVDWSQLYRARGSEARSYRPCFSGDVYEQSSQSSDGSVESLSRSIMILQHPCAMRVNGVDLVPRLLVAEVRQYQLLKPKNWATYSRIMPLPDLRPEQAGAARHHAALFTELDLVQPAALGSRVASLSARGVNLLLQRWLHHNSRVVVPTSEFLKVIGGPFEEADLVEEWCEERPDLDPSEAAAQCVKWLRQAAAPGGEMRQKLLEDEQNRSAIRREMRRHLRL